MPTAKQLQEQRAPVATLIRQMADRIGAEKRDFTPEERVTWDQANKDFDALTAQIDAVRATEFVDDEFGERDRATLPGNEDTVSRRGVNREEASNVAQATAIQAWVFRSLGLELTDQHKRACKVTGISPSRGQMVVTLPKRPESRAMSVGSNSGGGYSVPTGFIPSLEKALKQYAAVRTVASVFRTEDGRSSPQPTTDDTGNIGERLDENTEVAYQDVTLGVVTFAAYKYSSKMVKLSQELLDDSALDFATELGTMLGERIARKQAVDFTTGSGSSQPQGIVTASTLGVTAASATAIAPDEIISLIHSVDPAYRQSPNFALMMADTTLAYIRKLKDGQGRYLFIPDTNSTGGRIHGVPVVVNPQMASIATGNKTVLAGDFSKFKIRDVNTVRFRRLEERYAELDQVGFIAFLRSDSRLMDAGTHPVKHLIQA
ncbi:MAG: phage major capsid protein [Gemmataceae bacterium]